MAQNNYFILQVFLLCLCSMRASGNPQSLIFEAEEEKVSELATYSIQVNATFSLHECDARYLSVALGSQRTGSAYASTKLVNMAAALAPCEIRLGGTPADYLVFNPDGVDESQADKQEQISALDKFDSGFSQSLKAIPYFNMTGKQWDSFIDFITQSGWDLLFNVNLFFWKPDGFWDPTNAELLLNYSSARGVRISSFALGNEPSAFFGNYKFKIEPSQLVEGFKRLKALISKYPLYASSKLYGPDIGNVIRSGSARIYFYDFVKAGAYNVLDEYTVHHYYCNSDTATSIDFLSAGLMDSLKTMLLTMTSISKSSPRPLPIRQTETSSCYGGGASGLSDRYISGFLWLDKLGLSAKYRTTRLHRQSFLGATYPLIRGDLFPNPDYFLSVLFKRLVEGPVFNITVEPATKGLRVYAHCARRGLYSPGALVVYYLNINSSDTVLLLAQYKDSDLDLYLLTPGEDNNLQSSYVKLNGVTLLMSGATLPPMPPKAYKGEVTVTATSFGFIVVPRANVPLCVEYYNKLDSELNNQDGQNIEK